MMATKTDSTTANLKVGAEEAVLTVTRTMFGQTEYDDKRIKVRPFATDVARVKASLGRTIKVGEFEFLRVDVSFEAPCYKEEILSVYNEVLEMAKEELGKIVDEALESVAQLK